MSCGVSQEKLAVKLDADQDASQEKKREKVDGNVWAKRLFDSIDTGPEDPEAVMRQKIEEQIKAYRRGMHVVSGMPAFVWKVEFRDEHAKMTELTDAIGRVQGYLTNQGFVVTKNRKSSGGLVGFDLFIAKNLDVIDRAQ